MPGIGDVWYHARPGVAGGHDDDEVVLEHEIIQILELNEAPLLVSVLIKGDVAPEAQVEHADIRVGSRGIPKRVEERLSIDLGLIVAIGDCGQNDIQKSTSTWWRCEGGAGDDVAEYDARGDTRSMVAGICLLRVWVAKLSSSIGSQVRVLPRNTGVDDGHHGEVSARNWLRIRRSTRHGLSCRSGKQGRPQWGVDRLDRWKVGGELLDRLGAHPGSQPTSSGKIAARP
jgi:hypothetical protein